MPRFSWSALVELVVPIAITVLVVQNAQASPRWPRTATRRRGLVFGLGAAWLLQRK